MHPKQKQSRPGFLFGRLSNRAEIERGWIDVLAHYKPGELPRDLQDFEKHRGRELDRLTTELASRTFIPSPAALISIPKPSAPGEKRTISLLRPDDRIILTVLARVLGPLFERHFSRNSYAYLRGRSALAAVQAVDRHLAAGCRVAATADIDDFFDSIDRNRLLARIRTTVWEQPVLELIETYLHIGSVRQFDWGDTGTGIAQGSPLSPLLSNVYLIGFDEMLDRSGTAWVRYADNFVLLAPEQDPLKTAAAEAVRFLDQECGLRLNDGCPAFSSADGSFEFLGFLFRDGTRIMAPARVDQKRAALRAHFAAHPTALEALVAAIAETALGWRRYYGTAPGARAQLADLQQHLFDLFVPWMQRYRTSGSGKGKSAAELKAALMKIELPSDAEPRRRLQWAELLLARSRPEKTGGGLSPHAKKAIAVRKRETRRRREDLAEILITRPGTYLGRTGERLVIRHDGQREAEIPLNLIRNITLVTSAFSVSGELLTEAASHGVFVHLLGPDGRPRVVIAPPAATAHGLLLAQSRLADSPEGMLLARTFVAGKIANQINLLRYYSKYAGRRGGAEYLPEMLAAINAMEQVVASLAARPVDGDRDLERGRLFAAEGQAAGSYWKAVKALLWQKPGFHGRVRKGAGDLVNSLLNYGYGMLYSRLHGMLVRAGLNPTVGFLHKVQPGKSALLYDFIEEFRQAAVDRVVFSQLNLGRSYAVGDTGLTAPTKQDFARHLLRRLQAGIRYHGEAVPLEKVMECQAQLLVRHIECKEVYKTFVLPW